MSKDVASSMLPLIAIFAIIGCVLYVTFGMPDREPPIDERKAKIGKRKLSAIFWGGKDLTVRASLIVDALDSLRKASYIGSAGSEFIECTNPLTIEYGEKTEVIQFYHRPPSLKDCALAKSSLSFHYYDAYELLNAIQGT